VKIGPICLFADGHIGFFRFFEQTPLCVAVQLFSSGRRPIFSKGLGMHLVQRKYKIVRASTLKDLGIEVNELLEREYKDTEGYLYVSSGRWQCLGTPFKEEERWIQAVVFMQSEE
ncbi:uncharacterized protein METZ01_LOCUS385223, partial [marine metagenome]